MPSIILGVFEQAARAAGAIALAMQKGVRIHTDKGEGDFGTQADIEAGNTMRAILQREFPDIPILSEEQPEDEQTKALQSSEFIVFDELDATLVYYHGGVDWGHNIGLVQHGILTHALMYLPAHDILVTAKLGEGCYLNGTQVRLRQDTSLSKTILGIIFNKDIPRSFHDEVATPLCYMATGTRCLNSNIGGITEVIRGSCSGFLNPVGHTWDFVGALAVREAGGVAIAPNGENLRWDTIPMRLLTAANQHIADQMLAVSSTWKK